MKLQKLALTAMALSMSAAFAAGYSTDKKAEASSSNQAATAQSSSSNQPASSSANTASSNKAASSSTNQASSNTAASSSTNGAQSGMSSGATAQADPQVRQAQQALKDKGHDPGSIDGIMGPKTQQALQSFQQAQGISGSGELDQQTLAALGVQGDSLASNTSANQPSSANSGSSSASQASSGNQAAPSNQASSTNQSSSTNQTKQ